MTTASATTDADVRHVVASLAILSIISPLVVLVVTSSVHEFGPDYKWICDTPQQSACSRGQYRFCRHEFLSPAASARSRAGASAELELQGGFAVIEMSSPRSWRSSLTSASGTFETCRRVLKMSANWGGPECAGRPA